MRPSLVRFPAPMRARLASVTVAGSAMWLVSAVPAVRAAMAEGASLAQGLLLVAPPLAYWLGVSPLILLVAQRFPLQRGHALTALPAHGLAAAALSAGYAASMVALFTGPLRLPGATLPDASAMLSVRFQFGLLSYAFVAAWATVHESLTRLRASEVAAARLATELAQAQLRALKAQLRPHFLFNTLHAITVLIRRDVDEAERMVMRLSDLLRLALADEGRQEVPLAEELRFTRLYLEIEQVRFRARLGVRWEVPPSVQGALVPALVLQPLVENAIRHAIEPRREGGTLLIRAARHDGALELSVTDDGPGPGVAPARPGQGIGLAATRGRLRELYGEAARLEVGPAPAGGTTAAVRLPWRTAVEGVPAGA